MSTETLLIELGTEELPPKALKSLGLSFRDGIVAGLEQPPQRARHLQGDLDRSNALGR